MHDWLNQTFATDPVDRCFPKFSRRPIPRTNEELKGVCARDGKTRRECGGFFKGQVRESRGEIFHSCNSWPLLSTGVTAVACKKSAAFAPAEGYSFEHPS